MADFDALRTYLEEHRDELIQSVNDPEFERGFTNLQETWQQQAVDPKLLQIVTERQMRQYPSVWQTLVAAGLVQDEPQASIGGGYAPGDSRSTGSPESGDEGHSHQPEARIPSQGRPSERVTTEPEKTQPVKTKAGGNHSMNEQQPDTAPRPLERTNSWERKIIIGKELVTGMMGVAIITVTLIIAFIAIFSVNNTQTYAAAKDVLLYLNGLVGIVLGYYFGRVPGDMRAQQATSDARDAQGKLDRTVSEVRAVLDTSESFTRSGETTLTPTQVEHLRRILREY